ncbi:MAG: hypothetical protein CME71_05820 [Halobacteriovorax sp.]|nr:hypothetical protein [Halobacteriovorax sp.]
MSPETKFIRMRDDVELFAQVKESGSDLWLIVTHGIGEHSGRHQYFTELLGSDFNILYYDLRGHGKSLGPAATIENFDIYRQDLQDILRFLRERYKMKKFVLFGHSMGALITAGFVQQYRVPEDRPELVYLNAPPAGFPPPLGNIVDTLSTGVFKKLAGLSASIRLGGLVDLAYLSHDPQVKEKYIVDPLNALKLHTKLLLQLAKDSKLVFSKEIEPECPAFVSWGSEDRIISPEHLQKYFSINELNFEVRVFEGAFHEIHNEVDKFRQPYFDYLVNCIKQARSKSIFHENTHE